MAPSVADMARAVGDPYTRAPTISGTEAPTARPNGRAPRPRLSPGYGFRRETRLEYTPRPRLPLGARGFANGVGHYPGQAQAALPTALERGVARRARARGRGDRARPCDRLRRADRAGL